MHVSSRRLSPGPIVPLTLEFAEGWIPGTRPGMTIDAVAVVERAG